MKAGCPHGCSDRVSAHLTSPRSVCTKRWAPLSRLGSKTFFRSSKYARTVASVGHLSHLSSGHLPRLDLARVGGHLHPPTRNLFYDRTLRTGLILAIAACFAILAVHRENIFPRPTDSKNPAREDGDQYSKASFHFAAIEAIRWLLGGAGVQWPALSFGSLPNDRHRKVNQGWWPLGWGKKRSRVSACGTNGRDAQVEAAEGLLRRLFPELMGLVQFSRAVRCSSKAGCFQARTCVGMSLMPQVLRYVLTFVVPTPPRIHAV